jgi:hypothetical protein
MLLLNPLDKLTLKVFDEDVMEDDLVGEVTIDLKEAGVLVDTGVAFKEWIWDIFFSGKKAGTISVATRYTQQEDSHK